MAKEIGGGNSMNAEFINLDPVPRKEEPLWKCVQHIVIYWDSERLLVFTFNDQDICIASTVHPESLCHYIGRDKTFITMAMASIFHYPSIWTIRPES